jgi:hypothetical protein
MKIPKREIREIIQEKIRRATKCTPACSGFDQMVTIIKQLDNELVETTKRLSWSDSVNRQLRKQLEEINRAYEGFDI